MENTEAVAPASTAEQSTEQAAPAESVGTVAEASTVAAEKAAPAPQPLEGFSFSGEVARGIVGDEGKPEELEEKLLSNLNGVPTADEVKTLLNSNNFTQAQADIVKDLIVKASGLGAHAKDTLSRIARQGEVDRMEKTLRDEYGNSGYKEAKAKLKAWGESYGIDSKVFVGLAKDELLGIMKKLYSDSSANAATKMNNFASRNSTAANAKLGATFDKIAAEWSRKENSR